MHSVYKECILVPNKVSKVINNWRGLDVAEKSFDDNISQKFSFT